MKNLRTAIIVACLFTSHCGSPAALASTCPDPPNLISPQVLATVAYDPQARTYRYRYTVVSAPASIQEIDRFVLESVEPMTDVSSPSGWRGVQGFAGRPVVSWDAAEVENPFVIDDDASVPTSIVQVKPGARLGGFGFDSVKPPGQVTYYMTGFVPLPGGTAADEGAAEEIAEALIEECPQLQAGILDQAFVGTTRGPVDARADLVLSIDGPATLPRVVNTAKYTVRLENVGPDAATLPRLAIIGNTLRWSAKLTPPDGWSCSMAPRKSNLVTVSCSAKDVMQPGATVSFALEVSAKARPSAPTLVLEAEADSPTPDPDASNNSAVITTLLR